MDAETATRVVVQRLRELRMALEDLAEAREAGGTVRFDQLKTMQQGMEDCATHEALAD